MKTETVCIPLFGGIGNIIQTLPFAYEMKLRYKTVNAFVKSWDYGRHCERMIKGVFNKIYNRRRDVPGNQRIFTHAKRRKVPEYKCWFIDNNEPFPDKFYIWAINYKPMNQFHNIVIWPECKKNWPCKRWDKWQKLINQLSKTRTVAVVGLEHKPLYKRCIDYRGKLSLMETGGIIKNAKNFIGNEGGISHYAAALGTKTHIIMGCSDDTKNLPPQNAIKISKGLDCQPCQFNGMKEHKVNDKIIMSDGCQDIKCMKSLKVKEVMEKIK